MQVHAYIISYLKDEMPALFGAKKKQTKLIDNLEDVFQKASARRIQQFSQIHPTFIHFMHFMHCNRIRCRFVHVFRIRAQPSM